MANAYAEVRIILTKSTEYCFKKYQLLRLSTGDGLRDSLEKICSFVKYLILRTANLVFNGVDRAYCTDIWHVCRTAQHTRATLCYVLCHQFNQKRFAAFTLNGAGAIVNPGRGTSVGSGSPSGTLNQNS